MMNTSVSIRAPPEFLTSPASVASRNIHKLSTVTASWRMSMDSGSFQTKKGEELSLRIHQPTAFDPNRDWLLDPYYDVPMVPELEMDFVGISKLEFGQFVARKALRLEEHWAAAWMRAETVWENRDEDRLSKKMKFMCAHQEFRAIRRRFFARMYEQSQCIVAVRREDVEVKPTEAKTVVGTLDLTIPFKGEPLFISSRWLLPGEVFPGVIAEAPRGDEVRGKERYSYLSSLVVSKSDRRQGIATNMLQYAVETSKSKGVKHIYVHVDRNNKPAQQFFEKMGFEMVEEESEGLVGDDTYLLRRSL